MNGLTAALAKFVAAADGLDIPADAIEIAKSGFIDTAATMTAGRHQRVVEILIGLSQPGDEASILFGLRRASARDAALVNGAAGHVLDYDDVALLGHPSVVLVPAVLAEAERLGASGADALRAYVVGYEVWAELAWREPDPLHVKGWHPTTVLGTIGAAAAVAALNRFDEDQAANALAIAASLSGGLVANFGTMTKSMQVGLAAAHGIDAVRMAEAGLTGAHDAIEHPAGFLSAISPKGSAERTAPAPSLGQTFAILEQRLSVKKYPMCYATHRAIDGVIDLATANDLKAGDVKEVCVTFSPTQASILRNHAPVTGLEAKFSIEHAVAAALLDRAVGFSQLTDAYVGRPEVRELFPKVRTELVDTNSPGETGAALTERVVIETNDGRRFDSGEIRFARGHAQSPLPPGGLAAKFLDCTADAEWFDHRRLLEQLEHMESLNGIRTLAA
jgi:aconitate decarboxylase